MVLEILSAVLENLRVVLQILSAVLEIFSGVLEILSVVNFLTSAWFLLFRRISVLRSVYALCTFREQYNVCFNMASNNKSPT